MATGLGSGLAVPHARIEGLSGPAVGLGISHAGIDFDAPDGRPANLVFLLLTPRDDDGSQLELLADIARTFRGRDAREQALKAVNFTEFVGLMRSHDEE